MSRITLFFVVTLILTVYFTEETESEDTVRRAIKIIETKYPELKNVLPGGPKYMELMRKVIEEIQKNKDLQKTEFGTNGITDDLVNRAIKRIVNKYPELKNAIPGGPKYLELMRKVIEEIERIKKQEKIETFLDDDAVKRAIKRLEEKYPELKNAIPGGPKYLELMRKVIEEIERIRKQEKIENFLDDAVKRAIKRLEEKYPELKDVIPGGPKYLELMKKVIAEIQNNKDLSKYITSKAFTTKVETGVHFPCAFNTSSSPPVSVHELRPSDIKVVAAIGDSLTAGMGINSKSIISIFTQYRGHSFTMGGADDLSQHATLPNILKKFNPNLRGYSTGIGGPDGKHAKLNVANVGDRAEAMPSQARELVKRMRTTPGIDFENDWKIINVFVGGNDICDYCKFPERFTPEKYKQYIVDALEYLEANVPRAFVNLIEVLDASAVTELKEKSLICKALLTTFWCKCEANRPKKEVSDYARSLQRVTQEIMEDPNRFNKRDDFTVVLQPFLRHTDPPTLPDGSPDLDYFAPDCFHFSALGHSKGAIGLWNNMIQPLQSKDTSWDVDAEISCPDEEMPFLATAKNSLQ